MIPPKAIHGMAAPDWPYETCNPPMSFSYPKTAVELQQTLFPFFAIMFVKGLILGGKLAWPALHQDAAKAQAEGVGFAEFMQAGPAGKYCDFREIEDFILRLPLDMKESIGAWYPIAIRSETVWREMVLIGDDSAELPLFLAEAKEAVRTAGSPNRHYLNLTISSLRRFDEFFMECARRCEGESAAMSFVQASAACAGLHEGMTERRDRLDGIQDDHLDIPQPRRDPLGSRKRAIDKRRWLRRRERWCGRG